jgi:hypothetical protein
MLFDLRSRRRRRVVKGVYVFLALLIGVGLVGFGVGTGGNFGGIFNAASGGGGTATGQVTLEKALTTAEKATAKHPDAATWDTVGRAAYNLAEAYYVNSSTATDSGFEKQGFPVLAKLKNAWSHYLAVLPTTPDQGLAADVASAFGAVPTGIQEWATAESAQEIVTTASPTFSEYYTLAYDAYNAHEISQGDLAGARALALVPKSEKTQAKEALALYKQEAEGTLGSTSATGSTSTSSTSTTGSTGTSSTTTSSSTTSSTSTSTSTSTKSS